MADDDHVRYGYPSLIPRMPAGPCVGGPYDGKGYISNAHSPTYMMCEEMELPLTSPRVVYHLCDLHFPENQRIYFWRHEELSPYEAVKRVFEAYSGGNNHGQKA